MVMGAVWDNPLILFVIISLISWFFQRDKGAEKPDNKPNRKYTSPPLNSEPVRESTKTVVRNQDEDIRKKIQERERELQKKVRQRPDLQKEATSLAQTIKEQYEAQKNKVKQAERPVIIKETKPEISVPKEFKPSVQKAVKQTKQAKQEPVKRGFNARNIDLQEAFIMSEILGPPRSRRKQIR